MAEQGVLARIRRGFAGQLSWSGSWRGELNAQAERLTTLARAADLDDTGRAEVASALDAARRACREWPGPTDWITGRSRIAWVRLHAAETQILCALPDDTLRGWLPYILAVCRRFLPAKDTQLLAVEAAYPELATAERLTAADRALLGSALTRAYDLRNSDHERSRRFRNALIGGVIVITGLMLTIILVAGEWPDSLSLCTVPGPEDGRSICPSSDSSRPARGDLPLIALLGVLGAALAVARPLSDHRQQQRYSLAIPLFLLKLPIGAATAVAGLWALNSNFVPGVASIDSRPAMFFWAVVLGYGQQLLTRILDNRAATLDEPAVAPAAPVPPPAD
ncbi:hypothetical protein GCM10027589_28760 [Actinocorallia lasiicapitis]